MSIAVTMPQIHAAFETVRPELESRLKFLSRRFVEPDEAYAEMLASCWTNFRSKAERKAEFLPASQMSWMANIRLRSGRVTCGYSMADVLGAQTFKAGRVRVLLLSQLSTNKRRFALTESETKKITSALSTSEHERPEVRAATRIDWAAFIKGLDNRLRRILHSLSIGESKTGIAKQLGVSPCRITQLLTVLAEKIREFFGVENLPYWCAESSTA